MFTDRLSVTDLEVTGRHVLLRSDLDVPLDKRGNIIDERRLELSLATITYLIQQRAKCVILSHLGRPKGYYRTELSLMPVAHRLTQLLKQPVLLVQEWKGEKNKTTIQTMKPGEVVILENLRFCIGEEENNPGFTMQLAALGDEYVNDAFGASVRAHASTYGIGKYFQRRAAGLQMAKELAILDDCISCPEHPSLLIAGGKKVDTKLGVIQNLLDKLDMLLLGGVTANTFLKAMGNDIGSSEFVHESIGIAHEIINKACMTGTRIILPEDFIVHKNITNISKGTLKLAERIPAGWKAVDIGPKSQEKFSEYIGSARSIIWNGPMGLYEFDGCEAGTAAIAKAISHSRAGGAHTLVGGGDTMAALRKIKLDSRVGNLSSGGGAMLSYLSGEILPGIEILTNW